MRDGIRILFVHAVGMTGCDDPHPFLETRMTSANLSPFTSQPLMFQPPTGSARHGMQGRVRTVEIYIRI